MVLKRVRDLAKEVRSTFKLLQPLSYERVWRLWAGAEAKALGLGGITIVRAETGMSGTTVSK